MHGCVCTEMRLNRLDIWGHFAPMFHLVDAFAIYAVTLVGGRHVISSTFSARDALLTIGKADRQTDGRTNRLASQ
jgi:hypothetical protein